MFDAGTGGKNATEKNKPKGGDKWGWYYLGGLKKNQTKASKPRG